MTRLQTIAAFTACAVVTVVSAAVIVAVCVDEMLTEWERGLGE